MNRKMSIYAWICDCCGGTCDAGAWVYYIGDFKVCEDCAYPPLPEAA